MDSPLHKRFLSKISDLSIGVWERTFAGQKGQSDSARASGGGWGRVFVPGSFSLDLLKAIRLVRPVMGSILISTDVRCSLPSGVLNSASTIFFLNIRVCVFFKFNLQPFKKKYQPKGIRVII